MQLGGIRGYARRYSARCHSVPILPIANIDPSIFLCSFHDVRSVLKPMNLQGQN